KLSAGQKCCADEAYEKNGQCVPLVVPLNPFVKVFEGFLNLIIPSAHARMDVIQDGDGGGGGGGGRPSGSTDVNAQYRARAQQEQSMGGGQGVNSFTQIETSGEDLGRVTVAYGTPSNFDTCEINLLNDYAKRLAESRMPGGANASMLDVELALLAFEFVAGGNQTQIEDYWRQNNKS